MTSIDDILHDVVPARLKMPEGEYPQVRLVVLRQPKEVLVYQAQAGRAVMRYRREWTSRTPPDSAGKPFILTMADGSEWSYYTLGGCGCGSPLRAVPLAHDVHHNVQPV